MEASERLRKTEVNELNRQLNEAKNENTMKDTKIESMEKKEIELNALLAMYQAKILNMVETIRLCTQSEGDTARRLTTLELELSQQCILVQSQKETIESLRLSRSHFEEMLREVSILCCESFPI